MESSSEPGVVEFVHRRLRSGGLPPGPVVTSAAAEVADAGAGLSRRTTIARAVLVVAGAAGLAWLTQRVGQPLGAGLCAFFGALPVLWFAGWVIGALTTMRKVARTAAAHAAAVDMKALVEASTEEERVRLKVLDTGLEVTRTAGETSVELVGWQRLHLERMAAEAVFLSWDGGLPLQVPRSAFRDRVAFDDFCLAAQRHVWRAQP